jgi:hypothetical protein
MNVLPIWTRTNDIFDAMVDALAGERGDGVALIQSYFDESFDDETLCVGGYVFKNTKAKLFNKEWRQMLACYRLPYFRMSACNAGTEPFHDLDRDQRVAVQTEAIALIGKYAAAGYAVTVDQGAFDAVVSTKGIVSSAYELCVWECLLGVNHWLKDSGITGSVAYFFEAGHVHQTKANRLMNQIFAEARLRKFYQYKAHAFVDKEASRPTQAADILVWQRFKQIRRLRNGHAMPRADCVALMNGTKTFVFDIDRAKLQQLVDAINGRFGSQEEAKRIAMASPEQIAATRAMNRRGLS